VNSAIDVVQDLREMAENRGADVARLELVLVNLISNAIKYSARKPKRLVEIDMAPSDRADVCTIRIVITHWHFRIRSRSSTVSIADMPVATASWGTADSGWACLSSTTASAL
jgi:signal transduction histidine kinase